MERTNRIGIFGNIAIDFYPLNSNQQSTQNILDILTRLGIRINEEPKQVDPRTRIALEEIAKHENLLIEIGGGGYNSKKAFLKLAGENDSFTYFDLSCDPTGEGFKLSGNPRVVYCFQNLTPISRSLITKGNSDRKIIKDTRYDQSTKLGEVERENLRRCLKESSVLFTNSVGNYEIAAEIGSNYTGRPKFVVVTKALKEQDMASAHLLKGATAIIDIEEADTLSCDLERTNGEISKSGRNISKILERLVEGHNATRAVVTMGKDGLAYYDSSSRASGIMRTLEEKEKEIQKYLVNFGVRKNGAGDYFAAALAHYVTANHSLPEALELAQQFVVKRLIKFPGSITSEDYTRSEIK